MNSIYHIVKVHFDRRSEKATPEWFQRRFQLFKEYTLRGLKSQTLKSFTLWIHCDPGMEEIIDPLRTILYNEGIRDVVYTFQQYGHRPWDEFTSSQRHAISQSDSVYVTRIDSDDIFCCSALQEVNRIEPKNPNTVEASIFRRGYLYDTVADRLGVYYNPSSPFHTLMFPRRIFLDPTLYQREFVGDHSMVNASYHVHSLPDWKFCVLIHDSNFLSTFSYGREKETPVEKGWSINHFINQPIVFDVDDFCDRWGASTLKALDSLKESYPKFKCTLFTIPARTSLELLKEAKKRDWIELAVHGITHEPNEEMKATTYGTLLRYLHTSINPEFYVKGFRPPGWWIDESIVRALNSSGYWVALHTRDRKELGPICTHGYYICEDRFPYWHGHTHDVCGNWLEKHLPTLKVCWNRYQDFMKVSDGVMVPQEKWDIRGDVK